MIRFKTWIFSRLPEYYSKNDSYKDSSGQGLFERLIAAHGEELDDEVVDPLQDMIDILKIAETDIRFLPHIAYGLGNPPDFSVDDEVYRALLKNIIGIYQIKGTYNSYVNLFRVLGYNLTLITTYFRDDIYYDDEVLYDNDVIYDDQCNTCVEYTIFLSDLNADCENPQDQELLNLTQEMLDRFREIACFLEPINAKLIGINSAIPICEKTNIHISEELTITIEETPLYDNDENYD